MAPLRTPRAKPELGKEPYGMGCDATFGEALSEQDHQQSRRDHAEEVLCAAVLVDPSRIVALRPVIDPSDFSRPMRRAVFGAVDAMQREGLTLADPSTQIPFRLGAEFAASGDHRALSRLIQPVNPNAPLVDLATFVHSAAREDRARARLARAAKPSANGEMLRLILEVIELLDWKESRPRLRRLDFTSLDEEEVVPDLIPGRFKRGTKIVLASEPKTGKSLAAQDLALACATGGRWLGSQVEGGPYRVLYLDAENPEGMMKRRLRRLAAARGLSVEDVVNLPIRYCVHNALNLDDPAGLAVLEAEIAEFRPDVVVFDSLIRFRGPGADENSNSEAAAFAARVLAPLTARGITVIILHHLAKGTGDTGERSILSRVRGAGDLCAAVDDLFGLTRTGRGEAKLTHEFTRDGVESAPLVVRIEDVEICDGLRLTGSDAEDTSRSELLAVIERAGAAGVLREDLLKGCDKAGVRVATRMLGQLHERGRVRKRREGKVTRYWTADNAPKDKA